MRNVDSRIRSLRFDLLRIFILELLHSDFCNAIGGAKADNIARYERSVLNQCDIGWSMELAGRTILIVVAGRYQRTHGLQAEAAMPISPVIEITYCRLCGWGLRAGWMAQELLTTFAEELGSVTLTPDRTGGVFEVRVDNEVIWSRKERGRFPEIKEIKQLVRDRVAPGRSLGHTDTP
jgi:selenoprotein W-related protein